MTNHHVDYWRTNETLQHLTPRNKINPEGFDVVGEIKKVWQRAGSPTPICDFGCGVGRLAEAFPVEYYVGLDVNQSAVDVARVAHPERYFDVSADGGWPFVLAYSVFNHYPNNVFVQLVEGLFPDMLLIGEMMDDKWCRGGLPYAHNKSVETYADLLEGFRLVECTQHSYAHYPGEAVTLALFERVKHVAS